MSNPILNDDRFSPEETILTGEPMTIQGTVNKILLLFACLGIGAAISIYYLFMVNSSIVPTMITISAIVGFIIAIVTSFNVKLAKYTAAPYALLEGIVLGGISAFFETAYRGIALHAVIATFVVLFVMLGLYKARMITYTEKFASVMKTALLSVCAIYLIQIIASFFSRSIPLIFESGPVGIIFSLVVIGIAAMCFIQDFFFIEECSNRMLDKDYEWYGAFGLMVTVVWLYMEILRLLAKLNRR